MIPRTQSTTLPKQLTSKELYDALVPKLRAVKEDQEMRELLHKKLAEVSFGILWLGSFSELLNNPQTEQSSKLFDDALCAKLRLYDNKNDQDILDQHVTRVFDSPLRSPGNMSPSTNQFQRRKPHQESLVLLSGSELMFNVQNIILIPPNSQQLNHLCELRDHCRIQIYVKLKTGEA